MPLLSRDVFFLFKWKSQFFSSCKSCWKRHTSPSCVLLQLLMRRATSNRFSVLFTREQQRPIPFLFYYFGYNWNGLWRFHFLNSFNFHCVISDTLFLCITPTFLFRVPFSLFFRSFSSLLFFLFCFNSHLSICCFALFRFLLSICFTFALTGGLLAYHRFCYATYSIRWILRLPFIKDEKCVSIYY